MTARSSRAAQVAEISVRLVLGLFAMGLAVISARAYHSEQLLVQAAVGQKTVNDYAELLSDANKEYPWNSNARLKLADLMISRGRFTEALDLLQETSTGSKHWQVWERMGVAFERRAFNDGGTVDDAEQAAFYYDKVLSVYPTYQRGLERSGLLSLKLGDWVKVESVAEKLAEVNGNQGNIIYLRAQAASGLGQHKKAASLLGQLMVQGDTTTGSLFKQPDIEKLITTVKATQQ